MEEEDVLFSKTTNKIKKISHYFHLKNKNKNRNKRKKKR